MNAIAEIGGLAAAEFGARPLHLAIGMFDGVHLGHRAVIEPAVRAAREKRGVAAVLTFHPHPSALFRPEAPTRLIQDPHTKACVLARLGVEAVITQPFNAALARIEAEAFLGWLRERLPTLVAVYVGANFRFGHGRRGTPDVLEQSGRALAVQVMSAPRMMLHDEPVSSTRIRTHLETGEIEAANALLGYPYFAEGVVTPGKRLGRTLGFPTLNVRWAPQLQPRFGVYAVRLRGAGSPSQTYSGVANYGLRPTVENATEPRLEVHVLGPCPFDTDSRITVEWLHFIREERKFVSADELRAQIARDREAAAEALLSGKR